MERFQLVEREDYDVIWDTETGVPIFFSSDPRLAKLALNTLRRGGELIGMWVEEDDEGIAFG